jgi:hypothetical protein
MMINEASHYQARLVVKRLQERHIKKTFNSNTSALRLMLLRISARFLVSLAFSSPPRALVFPERDD